MRATCPECGGYFIASAMRKELVREKPPLWRPVQIDHQWCDTEGCKHHHETGVPYGTGEETRP